MFGNTFLPRQFFLDALGNWFSMYIIVYGYIMPMPPETEPKQQITSKY